MARDVIIRACSATIAVRREGKRMAIREPHQAYKYYARVVVEVEGNDKCGELPWMLERRCGATYTWGLG